MALKKSNRVCSYYMDFNDFEEWRNILLAYHRDRDSMRMRWNDYSTIMIWEGQLLIRGKSQDNDMYALRVDDLEEFKVLCDLLCT